MRCGSSIAEAVEDQVYEMFFNDGNKFARNEKAYGISFRTTPALLIPRQLAAGKIYQLITFQLDRIKPPHPAGFDGAVIRQPF
jgi:hypothetical protein